MGWDRKPDPHPVQLQVILEGVRYGKNHLGSSSALPGYLIPERYQYWGALTGLRDLTPYSCLGGNCMQHNGILLN